MNKKWWTSVVTLVYCITSFAQSSNYPDSPVVKRLPDITVVGKGSKTDYQPLPEIVGTSIYAGKKNALIVLDNVQGNVVNNTMRQVLAKIAGIQIWESDPSGIQIGIAARGLSPNRSWEFNVRQNGYDIAADPFGYPEAYYNPQLEAVQRIEIVRGQGSLQYGPQFGGMVNYILRNGSEIKKTLEGESNQTYGSNRLFNSYNALGGNSKKIHYYTFFNHKSGEGWRQNSNYYNDAGFGTITYKINPMLSITAELMRSHFRSQQPGGLTDSLLEINPKTSLRSRNWFDVTWTTPAVTIDYKGKNNLRFINKIYSTIGDRNSVGFLKSILIKDSINPATGEYGNRTVTLDKYRNFALESRLLKDFRLLNMSSTFSGGIKLYTGNTYRKTEGRGSTGTNYDIRINGVFPKDICFTSHNVAAFFENIFRVNKRLLIIPGLRYEWIEGSASGINGLDSAGLPTHLQSVTRGRQFLLAGLGAEYHLSEKTEFYSSFAQAYRPIQFANLQAAPTTDVIDPALKDAKGYNLDFGYRGQINNWLRFDLTVFMLQYNNRVGTVLLTDGQRFITNIGASTSKGVESFFSLNLLKAIRRQSGNELSIFGAYSYTDARYDINNKDQNSRGKWVENAPMHIFRGGITLGLGEFSCTGQINYTGSCFSDANNTLEPGANGQSGLIPAYTIIDFFTAYRISENIGIKAGINNLLSEVYFTRRAGGYPGPGALPGDGRTAFISLNAKF